METKKNEFCVLCEKPIKNNHRNRSKCSPCTTRIRRYKMKEKAVELLGGKCKRCDWSGNIAAFTFHHPNNDKEFNISCVSNKSWKIVVSEIIKCELLCSNCHHIEHSKYNEEKFIEAVKNYKLMR
jgi:ribosomal protein S27AE